MQEHILGLADFWHELRQELLVNPEDRVSNNLLSSFDKFMLRDQQGLIVTVFILYLKQLFQQRHYQIPHLPLHLVWNLLLLLQPTNPPRHIIQIILPQKGRHKLVYSLLLFFYKGLRTFLTFTLLPRRR